MRLNRSVAEFVTNVFTEELALLSKNTIDFVSSTSTKMSFPFRFQVVAFSENKRVIFGMKCSMKRSSFFVTITERGS